MIKAIKSQCHCCKFHLNKYLVFEKTSINDFNHCSYRVSPQLCKFHPVLIKCFFADLNIILLLSEAHDWLMGMITSACPLCLIESTGRTKHFVSNGTQHYAQCDRIMKSPIPRGRETVPKPRISVTQD